jgi:hypothetical protein
MRANADEGSVAYYRAKAAQWREKAAAVSNQRGREGALMVARSYDDLARVVAAKDAPETWMHSLIDSAL